MRCSPEWWMGIGSAPTAYRAGGPGTVAAFRAPLGGAAWKHQLSCQWRPIRGCSRNWGYLRCGTGGLLVTFGPERSAFAATSAWTNMGVDLCRSLVHGGAGDLDRPVLVYLHPLVLMS